MKYNYSKWDKQILYIGKKKMRKVYLKNCKSRKNK